MFYLLCFVFILLNKLSVEQSYEDHPCNRDCNSNKIRLTCIYDFNVEYYTVLSRSCFNCTSNPSDCLKNNCISANGIKRPIKVVNKLLPGPKIVVCKDDTIVVNVNNKLNTFESTTIHWHGIKQRDSVHMDGVGMVTQCPITPHTTFQYKFIARDAGTHFWHAHSASQRADGIFGPLIVKDPIDVHMKLYDEDLTDHIIVLNDWLKESIIDKYQPFLFDDGDEEIDGILINGKGVDVLKRINKRTGEVTNTPRAFFDVLFGKNYRFRVINSGVQYCPLEFSIDEHNITIIATDGNPIEPLNVASFIILPGERLDFVIRTNKQIKNYWIRVKGHADCEETFMFQTGVLRYNKFSNDPPNIDVNYETSGPTIDGPLFNPFNFKITDENKNKYIGMDDARSTKNDFTTYYIDKIKGPVNKKFYLSLDMNLVKNPEVYPDDETYSKAEEEEEPWRSPQINNITFHLPHTPFLFQKNQIPKEMICNEDDTKLACPEGVEEFCKCVHIINLDLNDVVEIVIADGGSQEENHPIHLHGQSFAVLGIDKLGSSVYMDDIKKMDEKNMLKRNLIQPVIKDTVTVPSGGYTIFRFYAENPGFWFMHCHIEFHSESGMALVFKVGNEKDLPPKPDDWPQCDNFGVKSSDQENNANKITQFNYSFIYLLFSFFYFSLKLIN